MFSTSRIDKALAVLGKTLIVGLVAFSPCLRIATPPVRSAAQADRKATGVEASVTGRGADRRPGPQFARFPGDDTAWIAANDDAMSFLLIYGGWRLARKIMAGPPNDARLAKANAARRVGDSARARQVRSDDTPPAAIYLQVNKNLVSPKITGSVDNVIGHPRPRYQGARDAAPPAKTAQNPKG